MRQVGLREIFAAHIQSSGREAVHSIDVLLLLVVNLAVAKDPLYELAAWIDSLDLRALGYRQRPLARFTDDRFARALDKLYQADRASLQTSLVVAAIKAFDLQLHRIHNDSTSVKACGRIPGCTRSGLQLRRGHSKDHRPELKQLLFTLSITADGAVPVHHHVYPGNRNDETTHIETWECLRALHGAGDFLYVADCKLCTRKQLEHIVGAGGRAITIVPDNLNEARQFQSTLRSEPISKKAIWRRRKPCYESCTEYFCLFAGHHTLEHGGYPIYWFTSSEKRKRDRHSREQHLADAEKALEQLAPQLNHRRLKKQAAIRKAADAILEKYQVHHFLDVRIDMHFERWRQRLRGRPSAQGPYYHYQIRQKVSYSLHWARLADALRSERRTDGIFPLLCTDPCLPPKSVLQAWKFQPRLEKRFEQFKHVHRAAPLLFKKITRIEANMFLFFVALMIQALLERCVRQGLQKRNAPPLKLYPEDRDAPHPTTSQLLKTFEGLCTYIISENDQAIESHRDELKDVHRCVLELLNMKEERFWNT